jgi:geranylgeranyl diphosphate synthase type II
MFSRDIYKMLLGPKVDEINRQIEATLQSSIPNRELRPMLVEATCKGRRFRPLLMLIANADTGKRWPDIIKLACALELLHKASLIHDDLVDHDSFRRTDPTLWRRFGHAEALIAGDLLIGLAFDLVSQWLNQNPRAPIGKIFDIFSKTLVNASVGEWMDLRFEKIETPNIKELRDMALLKSGALIMASIRIGAITGGATKNLEQTLTELGWQIGFIFQTVNDLNDLNGIDAISKRNSGSDMRLRKKNLVTHTLSKAGINLKSFQLLANKERMLAIEPVVSELKRQADDANKTLSGLPEGIMKQLCGSLIGAYRDTWFWLDEDIRDVAMSAL